MDVYTDCTPYVRGDEQHGIVSTEKTIRTFFLIGGSEDLRYGRLKSWHSAQSPAILLAQQDLMIEHPRLTSHSSHRCSPQHIAPQPTEW
jgi:hypothetical protein